MQPEMKQMSAAERLGLALTVICRRGCYLDYPLATVHIWLLPPAQLRQMCIFEGGNHTLLGYMTWAWFTEETETRWKTGQLDLLTLTEWNEGERLWIIDFVTLPGFTGACVAQAAAVFPINMRAQSLARRPVNGALPVRTWRRVDHGTRKLLRSAESPAERCRIT